MPKISLPIRGSRRCGTIQTPAAKPPIVTAACHRRGCQKMSASAFSLPAIVPAEGFELLAGEPVVGLHDPARRRHFCGWRISWIFARVAAREGFVTLRSAMFEGGEALRPYMETCASETLAFAQTGAAESFPEARDFGRFMAADRDWPG